MLSHISPHLTLLDVVDPRGRVDRKGLAILAVVLFIAQIAVYGGAWVAGIDLEGAAAFVIHSFFFWAASAAVSKRLHDLGRSAWALLGALCTWLVWVFALSIGVMAVFGPESTDPQSAGLMAVMTGSVVPVVAGILWLHLAKGDAGANRFGTEPDASGFARIDGAIPLGTAALSR